MRRVVLRSGRLGLLIGGTFWVSTFFAGEPLLHYVFGEEFAEAYHVLLLLTFAAAIAMAMFALEPTMYAIGRPQIALYVKVGASIVQVIAIVVLLVEMGLAGAGVAAVISNLLAAGLLLVIAARLLKRL